MDSGDLQNGFRLGEWLVEPSLLRITGGDGSRPIEAHQLRLLIELARRHGEAVDRAFLLDQVWPGQHATEQMLQRAVRDLHELLGDSASDPRYIVNVARRGYALIAHVGPLALPDAASSPPATAVGTATSRLVVRAHRLVVELKRRSVLKVVGAYLVGMWILLQVAETTFEPLSFPEWWLSAITVLAVIGIPIVATLAWTYEITAAGVTLDAADTGRIRLPRARRGLAPAIVLGVAMMAGVTGLAWWRSIEDRAATGWVAAAAVEPAARSIAVLPLVDMTSGGGNAYLGDGLSEELSAQLAQIPGLRVAARTSAFEFKGKSLDVRKIGEALGVRHVLEGSVRRDGDKLRVTVQLIDAANGYHLWAGSYDRTWADVIAIQEDISRSIARALELVLTPEAEQDLARNAVANLDAYDLYLAGVSAARKSADLSQANEAREFFRRALELDPGFSRAYAGLCGVGLWRYNRTQATADVTEAEAACRKALELDPTREETEMALARLYLASGRSEQAEAVYSGLVARRPGDADVHVGIGRALAAQKKSEEAEASFRRAVEVDPDYWGGYAALGNFLFEAGRAEESIPVYRKVTELTPASATAFGNLGAALLMTAHLEEATAAFEQSLAIEPSRAARLNLGSLYYYLGRFNEAAREYEAAEALASEDHQVVGAVADAYWLIPGRRPEAVVLYARAARLAEAALKVNPSDAVTWAQLGYYLGRSGDAQGAERALTRAETLGEREIYVNYYRALSAADRGDAAAAAAAAGRAEQLGYPRKLLEADPLLQFLLPPPLSHAG
jgi:TolB-like protein/DNA-binding winged helix-turn-helix (wHTH) protein/Tfp pilus assembly protein PilF